MQSTDSQNCRKKEKKITHCDEDRIKKNRRKKEKTKKYIYRTHSDSGFGEPPSQFKKKIKIKIGMAVLSEPP